MFQRITTWLVVAILGLVPLFGAASSALAAADSGFPAAIAVDALASGDVPSSATAPGSLALDRVTLPSKAGLPARQVTTVEILYVEKGTLTVADGLGLSSSLPEKKSVVLRAGSSYTAINDGSGDVSFLRLSLTASSTATPQAAASTAASAKAVVTSLGAFDVTDLPKSPTTLFLDRATWKAGADSGAYTQNGPIGMYTESGTLTISSPSGIDGQLAKGKAVLLPADQELRARNDGSGDAVALLFGVIPTGGTAVTAGAATTGTGDGGAGAPGVSTAAGTILYQADANGGFEKWSTAAGWVSVGGMLVNNGSSKENRAYPSSFSAAPFEAPGTDYAIEAEIQWARSGNTFGIVARGGKDQGYAAGFGPGCGYRDNVYLWAVGQDGDQRCDSIAYAEGTFDANWHTLRLEVQGNAVRVFLDGAKVIETTDNRFLTSGVVGVWSNGAQVNIRRFTVISLGGS